MKTPNLDKVLKNHFQHCKMHQYSLMKDRRCTCGVEGGRKEKEVFDLAIKWAERAYEWFEDHDTISVNSIAYKELEEIAEKLGIKK